MDVPRGLDTFPRDIKGVLPVFEEVQCFLEEVSGVIEGVPVILKEF